MKNELNENGCEYCNHGLPIHINDEKDMDYEELDMYVRSNNLILRYDCADPYLSLRNIFPIKYCPMCGKKLTETESKESIKKDLDKELDELTGPSFKDLMGFLEDRS